LIDHPNANKSGYVMEHRLIMEEQLGRYLTEDEVVHHKNGVKNDNVLENLEVMSIHDHRKLHLTAHSRLQEMELRIKQLEAQIKEQDTTD